jgi:hypothetical protein
MTFLDYTQTHAPVGILWTSDQPIAETCNWQHTTLTTDRQSCPSGIRTRFPSKWTAADPRLRRSGHWDRQYRHIIPYNLRNLQLSNLLHGAESFFKINCSALQEISRILRNPKVRYRCHNSRSHGPNLSQIQFMPYPQNFLKTFELQLNLKFSKIIEFCDVVALMTTEWLKHVTVYLQS